MKLPWSGAALIIAGIGAILWIERRAPLRRPVEAVLPRVARNIAIGALTAFTVSTAERPIVTRLSRLTEERRWGIVNHLPLPAALKRLLAIVLMDYSLYAWHVLLHR